MYELTSSSVRQVSSDLSQTFNFIYYTQNFDSLAFRAIPFEILMGAEWKILRTPLRYFYFLADPPPPRTYFIFFAETQSK